MDFLKSLGLHKPLIVAPMAGGPSSTDLIVATCEAGALGSLGAAYQTPEQISDEISNIRQRTNKPFAVNLFTTAPDASYSTAQLQRATEVCAPYRAELGLTTPELKPPFHPHFDSQFEVVLKNRPAAFSFIFGPIHKDHLREAQKQNIITIGTATNLEEALILFDLGVEALVLQGVQAGGHRALFTPEQVDQKISTLDLLKQVHSQVSIPLIAAGGIMNKQDIQIALNQGATAVQMGTAFLLTQEAGTSKAYRQALLQSPRTTELTRAFSGRWARGIENRFLLEMKHHPEAILPFPAQNQWTRDLRNTSSQKGLSDFLSLWCGSGAGDLFQGSAIDLIESLF